jgi:hypothetical protein
VAFYAPGGAYIPGADVKNPNGDNPDGEAHTNVYDQVDEEMCNSGECEEFVGAQPKWLDFNRGDLIFEFTHAVQVASYNWMTANDAPGRDPTKVSRTPSRPRSWANFSLF